MEEPPHKQTRFFLKQQQRQRAETTTITTPTTTTSASSTATSGIESSSYTTTATSSSTKDGPSNSNDSRMIRRNLLSWNNPFLQFVQEIRSRHNNKDGANENDDDSDSTVQYCGCPSCDAAVWSESDAAGHSCGARIQYLQNEQTTTTTDTASYFSTEAAACRHVAALEFPLECGACNPDSCQTPEADPQLSHPTSTTAAAAAAATVPSSSPRLSHYCGCPTTCTTDVWMSSTESTFGMTCAAHVAWTQHRFPEQFATDEAAACLYVANELPDDSPCSQYCNPATCNRETANATVGQPPPAVTTTTALTCGCAETCTASALGQFVDATSTCAMRIQWLMTEQNMAESDACRLVAGVEFPSVCGPHCDPAQPCPGAPTANAAPVTSKPNLAPMAVVVSEPTTPAPILVAPTPAPVVPPSSSAAPSPSRAALPTLGGSIANGLGPNVVIFDDSMSTASIQGSFDDIFNRQVNNEMGSERYSMYFMPGIYGSVEEPLAILIGYYTEVAGLGALPTDVTIYGKIEVYNRCFAEDLYAAGKFVPSSPENGALCFALNNFWRSLSNLSITIVHKAGVDACRRTAMFWAISQASSMRRVNIQGGDLSLMDYCTSK